MSTGLLRITSASQSLRRAPRCVVKRSTVYKQGVDTVGTTGATSHHVMPVLVNTDHPFIRFGNGSWSGTVAPDNDLLVDARLVTADGRILPVTFNGASTGRIVGNTFLDSDEFPSETLTAGTNVAVRTFYRGETAGATAPSDWYSDTGNGQPWYQTGNHLDDVAAPTPAPGPAYNNTFYYSPVGIYSHTVPATPPHFGILGDSNFHGQGDSGVAIDLLGYPRRALNNAYPYIHLSEGGMAITPIANSTFVKSLLPGVDYLIIGMLVNEIGTAPATTLANINKVAGWAKQTGTRAVIACTCGPNTSSTDNWATVANQTPTAFESNRASLNSTYRDLTQMNAGGALSNVDWICDATTAAEVDASGAQVLNGGRWNVVGGNPYGTAPHYSNLGHAAAATLLQDAITHVLAGDRKGISKAF